jgi:hypothetical protein
MVADGVAEAFQHADEAGGAQAGGAHQRAAARGADLDGRTEQGDAALGSGGVGGGSGHAGDPFKGFRWASCADAPSMAHRLPPVEWRTRVTG